MPPTHLHTDSARSRDRKNQRLVAKKKIAPPGLLRCLFVSDSDPCIGMVQAAAEAEAWEAIACSSTRQFMRNIFKQKHPLLLIDLPPFASANYREFRAAASWAKETSKALMVVSVEKGRAVDEVWARELGVWTYLSEMTLQKDWELMFREARQALARQAMAYLDSSAQTS